MDLKQYEKGAVDSKTTAPAAPTAGYPTNGDPATGQQATVPGAYWYYQIQAELDNLVKKAGLTPDHTRLTQLYEGVYKISMPVGSLIIWPTATPPAGYLECNGAALSRTTYAALYAVLGVTYGKGAGTAANTTFRLPDLRGQFIRGWDNGRGIDPDRAFRTDRGDGTTGDKVGARQAAALKKHNHVGLYNSPYGTGLHYIYGYKHNGVNTNALQGFGAFPRLDLGLHDNNSANAIKTGDAGGNETRPRNINMMFAIKY